VTPLFPTAVTDPDQDLRARAEAAGRQAVHDLEYLGVGLATSVLAMIVWIAGVTVTLSLAVFIVGIPAVLASAAAFRWVADLDRRNAARELGAPLQAIYRERPDPRLLPRVSATLSDPQTWRDLAWLVAHSVVGLAFGSVAVSCVVHLAVLVTLPVWFWALPAGSDLWGVLPIDGAWGALLAFVLAPPFALLSVALLRAMATGEARLAAALLGPPAHAPGATTGARDASVRSRRRVDPARLLPLHAGLALLIVAVCTLLWLLPGTDYFWPVWVALGLTLTVTIHDAVARWTYARGAPLGRILAVAEVAIALVGICVAVWALAGGGYPWPVWPALGLSVILGVVALVLYRDRLPWTRERVLVERVDELTRTRRGALDVQAAELRRIERDLHDGAQARLVSLSMLMGRAEEHLADQPEVAALVRQARAEAGAAIGELRDLAHGIAPPILVDRGLVAAVQSLALRVPIRVTVHGSDQLGRPAPVVETAAYFVIAESITNAAKHAGGAPVRVTVAQRGDVLVIEIADTGPGGADPAGSGLTGLRHRVEALDGTLRVGPGEAGRGTVVRAELPCAS